MKQLIMNAEKAIIEFEAKLEMINIELRAKGLNSIEHVKSRVKSNDSILAKLERKGLSYTAENVKKYIRDLGGIRVTVLFVDDVYQLLKMIQMQKDIKITRVKDYIKTPKKSGYQSLHVNLLVPVQTEDKIDEVEIELQIRTVGMDFFASVEHLLKYKSEKEIDSITNQRLVNCSKTITSLDKELCSIYLILSV